MSQRSRSTPRIIGEIKPISDKSKLIWERYYGPMNGAAQALNVAIQNTQNILGGIILELEGVSPETHIFDVDKMRIIPRPQVKGGNGNG